MSDLKITNLHKHYGAFHAVKGIDLDVPSGEFTVLVAADPGNKLLARGPRHRLGAAGAAMVEDEEGGHGRLKSCT